MATTAIFGQDELKAAVKALAGAGTLWASVSLDERAAMLDRLAGQVQTVADEWVAAATAAKGLEAGSQLAGEEWLTGPWALIAGARALARTLRRLDVGKLPFSPGAVRSRKDGQVVVDVYPAGLSEALLLHGYHAEIWQQPHVAAEALSDHVGWLYRQPAADRDRGVRVILGAGNIASITPLDIIHALFAQGQTALVKLSPVNDYLAPYLQAAFSEFVERGWVVFVRGGAAVGEALVTDPGIAAVHVTGSRQTYESIVFGSSGTAGTPRPKVPVDAELGGVSAAIVVGGNWSDADLRYQAEHLATQKLHNAGHNCVATQVVVLPADWPQVDRFAAYLAEAVARAPHRDAYYPGAAERHAATLKHAGAAVELGGGTPGRTLLADLDPTADHELFTAEAFGPVLATVKLAGDTAAYLAAATTFANERLWGTLGVNLIIDPATAKANAASLDQAIADLRYGAIAVNAWVGVAFLLARASWGAYPGATPDDIQSGCGAVHNACLFDAPQKTVVRAPFRPFPRSMRHGSLHLTPKPPWFVTNQTAARTGRHLTAFAADGNPLRLPAIFASALRG